MSFLRNTESWRKIRAWISASLSKNCATEPELKAAGILHIRVFGSVARDEATSISDVDLLADFDKSKRITLVKVGSLQNRLSNLLGARVDLSSADWMRKPVKSKALREAVIAF
jgi:hypothetical protein